MQAGHGEGRSAVRQNSVCLRPGGGAGDEMSRKELFEPFKNRRAHERLQPKFTLHYHRLEDLSRCQAGKVAELLDIGGGGIRFLTTERLENDCQLMVELEIPGWSIVDGDWVPTSNRKDVGRLRVVGKVRWTAPSSTQAGC